MGTTAHFYQFGPYFNAGVLVSAIKVFHYLPGTTTTKAAWSDRDKTTQVAQPLIGDGNGIATLYGDGLYDILITDSASATLHTFDDIQIGPVQPIEFSVHKNGTNQTISANVWTRLSWSTEVYDAASTFASDRWTPGRTGRALVAAAAQFDTPSISAEMRIAVYLNGSIQKQNRIQPAATITEAINIAAMLDITSATDFVEIYANSGADNQVINGSTVTTWFMGAMIA